MDNNNIPDDALEWLSTKDILQELIVETEKKIEKEEDTRKVILLVASGRNVENPNDLASYNLMVNAESGAGKDYVTSNTLAILPKEEYIKRKRITKKVFTYWHNAKFEPNWSWDKKVFYCEDIPNDVLNEDVFKVMSSSGNAISTCVINQRAFDIQINGKPIIIITIANANLRQENLRRFPICPLNEDIDQTKAIMERQAEFSKFGSSLEYDKKITEFLYYLQRIKVKIPFAKHLIDLFPKENIIMRTNFNRFLDYIKSSCALYQYQRQKDVDDYYLATWQDYNNAVDCIIKTNTNPFMIPLTNRQKQILKIMNKLNGWYFIRDLEPLMPFISGRSLKSYLDRLASLNLLKTENRQVEYERYDKEGNPYMVKGTPAQSYCNVNIEKVDLIKVELEELEESAMQFRDTLPKSLENYIKNLSNTTNYSLYSNSSNTSDSNNNQSKIEQINMTGGD